LKIECSLISEACGKAKIERKVLNCKLLNKWEDDIKKLMGLIKYKSET
jgi:hypothetical protein